MQLTIVATNSTQIIYVKGRIFASERKEESTSEGISRKLNFKRSVKAQQILYWMEITYKPGQFLFPKPFLQIYKTIIQDYWSCDLSL